jgi:hypothetical protein
MCCRAAWRSVLPASLQDFAATRVRRLVVHHSTPPLALQETCEQIKTAVSALRQAHEAVVPAGAPRASVFGARHAENAIDHIRSPTAETTETKRSEWPAGFRVRAENRRPCSDGTAFVKGFVDVERERGRAALAHPKPEPVPMFLGPTRR